jgi:hypothetical protein
MEIGRLSLIKIGCQSLGTRQGDISNPPERRGVHESKTKLNSEIQLPPPPPHLVLPVLSISWSGVGLGWWQVLGIWLMVALITPSYSWCAYCCNLVVTSFPFYLLALLCALGDINMLLFELFEVEHPFCDVEVTSRNRSSFSATTNLESFGM